MTEEELLSIKAQAEKLTRDDPSSGDAWRNLAQAKMMLGDCDGAIDDCVECLRLSPTDEYGLILLGNIYVNGKKDVATGLNYYKKAAEANPKSVLAECNIGAALARGGKGLEAVPHFRRALDLDRKNGLSYVNLAQCYQAMEDWHSAWLVANDALQFGEIAYENSQMRDQVCSRSSTSCKSRSHMAATDRRGKARRRWSGRSASSNSTAGTRRRTAHVTR